MLRPRQSRLTREVACCRVRLQHVSGLLALTLVAAIVAPAAAQETIELRAADNQEADYPTVLGLQAMADQLEETTGGRIQMKVYPGAQLGAERDTLEITIFGGIDVSRTSMAPLNSIVPKTSVFSLPFLFRSTEHMRRTLDGAIGDEILALLEPHGLIGLAYYDSGARSMYNTRRPIRSPADMEGLKIRVMNSGIFVDMIAALGGNATPMSFGQVYESLALGAIDGAENNWPSFQSTRHYEVAPYYSVTQHVMVPEVVVMSRYRWEKLSSSDQKLVREAAESSVEVMRGLWDEQVMAAREAVEEAGITIVDDVDKQAFIDAMEPLYEQYLQDLELRSLVERIRAVE